MNHSTAEQFNTEELAQAEQLALYLEQLDQDEAFIRLQPDTAAETVALYKTARLLKTVGQPVAPSATLLTAWQHPVQRRWLWFLPVPFIGVTAVAVVILVLGQPKSTIAPAAKLAVIDQVTAELSAIDQLSADFDQSAVQLNHTVDTVNVLTADPTIDQL